jgi:predicted DNA-binding protein (UPF0251 family)
MARPQCCRRVSGAPGCRMFKPEAAQSAGAEMLLLTLDELEALRLADLEGLYQEEAAQSMNISRQTFGRIIESARRKTARALVESRALKIEGGNCEIAGIKCFQCNDCHRKLQIPPDSPKPRICPACKGHHISLEDSSCGREDITD